MSQRFADMVDLIGIRAAMDLVEARGGTRVFVTTEARLTEDAPIARIVGIHAAAKLATRWCGEWIEVPKAEKYMRHLRDEDIRARREQCTAAVLAREYRLTERSIHTIWKDAPDSQMDMFAAQAK